MSIILPGDVMPARERIRLQEQIVALYQRTPLRLLSNGMVGLLMLVILWGWSAVNQYHLSLWCLASGFVLLLRLLPLFLFRRCVGHGCKPAVWGAVAAVGSLLSGLLWGISPFYLLIDGASSEWLDLLMPAILLMGAIAAGSVALLTPYLPGFYAFFYPALIPFIALLLMAPENGRGMIGMVLLLYLLALSLVAHRGHRSFLSSVDVRLENVDLVSQLTLQKEEAEKSVLAKSRFLAAASHDLRQPMHAISLFVEALRERIDAPDQRRLVDNISASVEAMSDLFNSLLDISRLDAGVIQPNSADFPLEPLMQRICAEYESACAAKGLRFLARWFKAWVHSDPALVERILRNFVTNAIRYTAAGGVLVASRRRGSHIRLEVWDTGMGIPPEKRDDIFQEFVQLDNPERDRNKGLGLGLAIVQRLATLLGHAVTVHSRQGRGSAFAIELPVAESPVGLHRNAQPQTFAGFPGMQVFVVDDEPAVLEGMRTLLAGWGCSVLAASSGDELVAQLANVTQPPDLIISDYRLRAGESGIDVIRRIQEEFNAPLPGVLITGDTAPDRLQEADDSGFELLHKPLQPLKLRALLSRYFASPTAGW